MYAHASAEQKEIHNMMESWSQGCCGGHAGVSSISHWEGEPLLQLGHKPGVAVVCNPGPATPWKTWFTAGQAAGSWGPGGEGSPPGCGRAQDGCSTERWSTYHSSPCI